RCDTSDANCINLGSHAPKAFYKATYADVGHRIVVTVIATDSEGQSTSATAPGVGPVANPPAPIATTDPGVGGTARDGETLTAQKGVWSSPDPLTYAYQWQRCDADGSNCGDVATATRSNYRLGSADVGHEVRVVVTATDKESQAANRPSAAVGP